MFEIQKEKSEPREVEKKKMREIEMREREKGKQC